jgi:chemotaxis protein methyltransferase CheR
MMAGTDQGKKLKSFFLDKTGIVLSRQQLELLSDAIDSRINKFGFKDIDSYLSALTTDLRYRDEFKSLVSQATVNESYFFRDPEQMKYLEKSFFPKIIKKRRESGSKTLRIWSAGCSSGQEIYSIAMILDQLIPDYECWNIHLLGTDIDTSVIQKAIEGKYTAWSIRNVENTPYAKYFTEQQGEFSLAKKIKNRVMFLYHNLSAGGYPSFLNGTSSLDLIVCRNVFLYIDKKIAKNVIDKFGKCLVDGGVLLLGVVDMLNFQNKRLEKKQNHGVSFYEKSKFTINKPPVGIIESAAKKKVENKPVKAKAIASDVKSSLFAITQRLLKEESWGELAALADEKDMEADVDADILLSKALALANMGKLDDAMEQCLLAEKKEDLNARNFLIQSLIHREKNEFLDAEKKIKQAIFLDKDFVDAYYCLGSLYLRQNNISAGLKQLRIAVRKIDENSKDTSLYISPSITYEQFKPVLEEELDSYSGREASA